MKALVSIQFALELDDEDDLVSLVQSVDQGMRDAIARHLESGVDRDAIEFMELGGMVDWYGVAVSTKKPVFGNELAGQEGGE